MTCFAAADGVSGRELWQRDGTAESTVMAVDIISYSVQPTVAPNG